MAARIATGAAVLVVSMIWAASASADVFVDLESIGGPCDDGRSVEQASHPETPWCTLAQGISGAPPGSTVLVRKGAYPYLEVPAGNRTLPVTVSAYAGEQPTVAGVSVRDTGFVRFRGLRLTAQSYLDHAQAVDFIDDDFAPEGIRIVTPQDVVIEGSHFHDIVHHDNAPAPDGYALWINSESNEPDICCDASGVVIRANLFDHVENDAIQIGGGTNDALVEGNEFNEIRPTFGAHGDPIQLVGTNRTIIRANRIHDSDSGLTIVHSTNRDVLIENNVITHVGWSCDCGHMPGSKFLNNTFWDNGFGGIVLADDQPTAQAVTRGLIIKNNILQSLAVGEGGPLEDMVSEEDYNLIPTGEGIGPHDVLADPKFVSQASEDYRLANHSPGIDAGTSDGTPPTDAVGRPRVDDPDVANTGGGIGYVDMGAYEHVPNTDATAPTVSLTAPADGATYDRGATVLAAYTCTDEAGGSGLASCVGTTPAGQPIETSALGSHTFIVTAADNAGNTASATVHYVVRDVTAPKISVTRPAGGAAYVRGSTVPAAYTCADDAGGSGLASCAGTTRAGRPIDTRTLGSHTFTIKAADKSGNTATRTVHYVVRDGTAPTISLTAPAGGAAYVRGSTVPVAYTCADEAGGSGLASCAGTTPAGRPIDTCGLGTRSFTVTSTDHAGNRAIRTVTYSLVGGPAFPPSGACRKPATVSLKLKGWKPGAGRLRAVARVRGGHRVVRVDFWVAGKRVRIDRRTPYRLAWHVPRRLRHRSFRLTAVAYDSAGGIAWAKVRVRARAASARSVRRLP